MPVPAPALPAPLQERNAEKERQLDEVRESLAREQLALSELRRAGAEERQSFTRSLQVCVALGVGWGPSAGSISPL